MGNSIRIRGSESGWGEKRGWCGCKSTCVDVGAPGFTILVQGEDTGEGGGGIVRSGFSRQRYTRYKLVRRAYDNIPSTA